MWRIELLLGGLILLCAACNTEATKNATADEPVQYFNNPILPGFNPDPSICRVGDDYYLVTSTFAYFPGIPILHSRDLVNWEQIGSAITRTEQMDFTEQGISRGLFAPTITYHDGWYYIVCTQIDLGGNFIVKAEKPEGPYSDPYWLPEVNGIDPSIFFDDDGKLYIIYNSIPPNNESLYDGHRTIRLRELDPDSLVTMGEEHLLINGGTDLAKEPVWIEAPHIYKRNGYYYLMAAEGGTAYNHSEVVFRAENILGPYESYSGNPILTQRHLDPDRPNPITTTGHADIVETPSGEWWAVFLGCRPYEGEHYNTGRETFLAPVRWEDGWPIINPDTAVVLYQYPLPNTGHATAVKTPLSGNYTHRIDFTEPPDQRWLFLRNVKEDWYDWDTAAGQLRLEPRPEVIASTGNPSLLLKRQPHLYGAVSTQLRFTPAAPQEMAGLVVMQNESHYYFLSKGADALLLLRPAETGYDTLARAPYQAEEVHLKIRARGARYDFLYGADGMDYETLAENVDATFLSTATAGGFVGCLYGLYATANGEESESVAVFNYLEIKNEDETNQ